MEEKSDLIKVLLVDDELAIRQGIRHYLDWEQVGFTIVGEATNGLEALKLISELQPHIVITDIVMPVMDGKVLTQKIKAQNCSIEVIILSSHADFDYVRSTFQLGVIDYILKPTMTAEILLENLKKAASRLTFLKNQKSQLDKSSIIDKSIEDLVNGRHLDSSQLKTIFPYSCFVVLGCALNHSIYFKKEIVAILKGLSPDYKMYFVKQKQLNLLIINSNEKRLQLVLAESRKQKEVQIFASPIFYESVKLFEVCNHQMQKLLQISFFKPDGYFLTLDELPKLRQKIYFNFEQLATHIRHQQFDRAFTDLLNYTATIVDNMMFEAYEYKAFLINSIFNISLEIKPFLKADFDLEGQKHCYFQEVDQINNASEGVQILKLMIKKIKLNLVKQPAEKENIQLIVQYIQKNYDKPLSLKTISEIFHFNASYLSSYFSSYYKEGFNEYLNKVRVKVATQLLSTTKKSISEIGFSVGYSDHSYFCKVFKKIMKVSPRQYRKNLKRLPEDPYD